MFKRSVKNLVKYFKFLYIIYFYIGSGAVRFLRLFVRRQERMILFVSFGGKKFDDSPRAIYEYMLRDKRFENFRFVWAFEAPERYELPDAEVIPIDTLTYYRYALRAAYWITNSGIERGLSFKRQSTFLLNTWHGTPIKRIGKDALNARNSYGVLSRYKEDVMLAQGHYEADIFAHAFGMDRSKYAITGLPRNDELVNRTQEFQSAKRAKLGIPEGKTVILYAPTFREYERDSRHRITLAPPVHFQRWHEALGEDYLILFRAHYEVAKVLNIPVGDPFVMDVSDYPTLNDLIVASDMLVSDYSSIFFDYAIQEKPIFCFAYDYDKYRNTRGLYFDLAAEIPGGIIETEDQLLQTLTKADREANIRETITFREKFIDMYGTASKQAAEIILKNS